MMKFFDATENWVKGEVFEASITALFGIVILLLVLILWRVGKTPSAQSLLIPLFVISIILSGSGIYNAYSNQNRLLQFKADYYENPKEFIQSEKERVEGFQGLYLFTKYLAASLFLGAILIFFFFKNIHWQAIAIAMVILGLSGLIIDFFSKQRADEYYQIILKQIA